MRKVLALIAHDSKKDDMVRLIRAHQHELTGIEIVATRSTGQFVEGRTGLKVTLFQRGALGGDHQIGAKVASDEVRAVIFLRDPLMARPHDPEVSALLRVCDVHNVPIATNIGTAEAVFSYIAEHPETKAKPCLAAQFIEQIKSIDE